VVSFTPWPLYSGGGSFLVPTGLRVLLGRRQIALNGNEPHRRTDVTIRVSEARAGAGGRGLERA